MEFMSRPLSGVCHFWSEKCPDHIEYVAIKSSNHYSAHACAARGSGDILECQGGRRRSVLLSQQ